MTIESDILQNLSQKVDQQKPIYLAYSGGLDSSVLLHVLAHSQLMSRIVAVHIHHGLSENADVWQDHCARACERLCVPFVCEKVSVQDCGHGIEAAARDQRLKVFSRLLRNGGVVITAHHRSDQVETFLYRALRGAGLTGLSAMKPTRNLGSGHLLRPMLSVSRDELEHYATSIGIQWIEDESNHQTRFDRNYIRAQVVPALKRRWSGAERLLAGTIENIQQSKDLLDHYLDKDLAELGRRSELVGESLDLACFEGLDELKQYALLRRWCEHLNDFAPEKKLLRELAKFLVAKEDAQPCLRWGSIQLRRFRRRLFLLPYLDSTLFDDISWDGQEPIPLNPYLRFRLVKSPLVDGKAFKLRFDKSGTRCKPIDRAHSQTIKRLFQEYAVVPWLRPFVPLVFYEDELISVGGLWQCSNRHGIFEFVIERINQPSK